MLPSAVHNDLIATILGGPITRRKDWQDEA